MNRDDYLVIDSDNGELLPDSASHVALQVFRCAVLASLITVAAWLVIRYCGDLIF